MRTRVILTCIATIIALPMYAQRGDREYARARTSHDRGERWGVRERRGGVQEQFSRIVVAEPRVDVRVGCEPFVVRHCPVIVHPEPVVVIHERQEDRRPNYYREAVPVMSEDEFIRMKHRLRNLSFDDDKVSFMMQMIDYNYFTSNQVADLLYSFSFDSNKLKIAKYAYEKTVDPRNYDLVFKTFDFQSSARELDEYIGRG